MQELDFSEKKKKKFKIKFSEGESYIVRLPSMIESRDFARKSQALEDDLDNIDLMIDFLSSLGLPKDKCEALDVAEMEELKNTVLSVKKS